MRVGTRGSALALAQAQNVAERLPGAELVVLSTSGDRGQHSGDKARWVDTIERALIDRQIDLAVHSAKDVPAQLADGLELVGSPPRADPRDVLCGARSLAELPPGARVGTGSLRRAAQLRALRDDLEPVALRGNVDTRLRKLAERADGIHAIVLARAGLERLGRDGPAGPEDRVPLDELVPAAGQGTLALQARSDDPHVRDVLAAAGLCDPDTELALAAERALVRALGADCHSALGAHARVIYPHHHNHDEDPHTGPSHSHARGGQGTIVELRAWIGLANGSAWISDTLTGDAQQPDALGEQIAQRMLACGAGEMLAAGEASPAAPMSAPPEARR